MEEIVWEPTRRPIVRALGHTLAFFLIYAAVLGGLGLVLPYLAPAADQELHRPDFLASPGATLAIVRVINVGLLLAPTLIMARFEGQSVWSYGLAGPRPIGNFVMGLCAGGALLSFIIVLLIASGNLVVDGFALHSANAIFGFGAFWGGNFLLVGFSEELLWRGYPLQALARGIGFWPAAVILSVLFAASHISNDGETFEGLLQVLIAGLIWCAGVRLTGSLWWGIGFHAAWNWAQSFLYGTANSGILAHGHFFAAHPVGNTLLSGGMDGPEGTLACLVVQLALLAAMIVMVKRRAGASRLLNGAGAGDR